MRRLLLLPLLAVAASAAPATPAPMTKEKLGLVPGLLPKHRRELAKRLAPLVKSGQDCTQVLLDAGVDAEFVRRLDELTPGSLLVERFAHKLVYAAPNLTGKQNEIFDHLLPAVTAAQAALWWHQRSLKLDREDPAQRRIASSFDRGIRQIEKRYWRVVALVLDVDQRAALHKLYPQPYSRPPSLEQHVYQLPGLTPSQAARVRALVSEFESETAADTAGIRRLRKERDPKREPEIHAAEDRISDVLGYVYTQAKKILTEEQLKHLDALPPLLSPNDRQRNARDFLEQMGLSEEQKRELRAEVEKRVAGIRGRLRTRLGEMEGEVGAEAPQAMSMQMMRQNMTSATVLAAEDVARETILKTLDKRRILGWIILPR